jgi:hypothetical protein
LRLGRTTFADAAAKDWGVPQIQAFLGARTWAYSEAWYLGNPGHYLTYVFSNISASPIGGCPDGIEKTDWDDQESAFETDSNGAPQFRPWAVAIHERTRINTVSVISSALSIDHWPGGAFGPHGDEVRLLP